MKLFISTPKGAAGGGAVQMVAVLALVLGIGVAAPESASAGGDILLLSVPLLGLTALMAVVLTALAAVHPPMRTSAWWVGQLTVLVVAALLLGVGGPAGAQETSANDSASSAENRDLSVGDVYIGEDCVQAGDVMIGDCGGNGGSGGEGPGGGKNEPDETTAPGGTTPEPAEPSAPPVGGDAADEGCAAEGPLAGTRIVTIERVIDGDTAELAEPLRGATTVRFVGVDTPETVDPEEEPEPFGEEASAFTERSLEGEEVALEIGEDARDDYGRLLAYPWTAEGMFSEALLEGGYGELLVIPPNDAYEECLRAAEERARAENAGIWGLDDDTGDHPAEYSSPDSSPSPSADAPEDPSTDRPESTTDDAVPDASSDPVGSAEPASQDQYAPENADAASPAPSDEPEVQEPEVQEAEIQDPEVQEGEIQEVAPETSAVPPADPTLPPSVASTASPPASLVEPVSSPPIVLPETGGPPLLALAAPFLLALLPAFLVTRAGLRHANRRRRGGGDL